MSGFPEAWNHPPAELKAVRKGDGWTVNLPWEPAPWLLVAIAIPLGVVGLAALGSMDASGSSGWSGVAVGTGVLVSIPVLTVMIGAVVGQLRATRVELTPKGVQFGKAWYVAQELPLAKASHDLDKTGGSENPSHTRVPVLELGRVRTRLTVDEASLYWLVGAINHVREQAAPGSPGDKAAMQRALDEVRQRAETEPR